MSFYFCSGLPQPADMLCEMMSVDSQYRYFFSDLWVFSVGSDLKINSVLSIGPLSEARIREC